MFFKTFILLLCYLQPISSENDIINKTKMTISDFLNLQASTGSKVSRTLIRIGGFDILEFSLEDVEISAIEDQMVLLKCPGADENNNVIWAINGLPFTPEEANWRRFIQNNSLALFPAKSDKDYGIFECYIGTEIAGQATLVIEKYAQAIGEGLYYYFGVSFCVIVTQIVVLTFYILYMHIYHPNDEAEADEMEPEKEDDFVSDPEDDDDESEEAPVKP